MPYDTFEKLQREAAKWADEQKKNSLCCGNCGWFWQPRGSLSNDNADGARVGRCMRYPPKSVGYSIKEIGTADGTNTLLELLPTVVESWVCGEVLHLRTGQTPYGDSLSVMRTMQHRIGDLEDQIDRMKREVK